MKTPHSLTRFALLRHALTALAFSLSVPGWAQQPAAPEATSSWEGARSAMRTIIPELDIPAGQHLRGVVQLLSDKTGANIVLDESLKGLKLPALKLRNVTVTSVLDTIRATSKEGIS